MKVTYNFSGFKLEHDTLTGDAFTHYPGGGTSERSLVPEDTHHAKALGITPAQAALCHELTHHLVGSHHYRNSKLYPNRPKASCAVTWCDANGLDMPSTADIAEWLITSFQYFAYRKLMPQAQDWGAIMDLQEGGVDLYGQADKLRKLMRFESVPGVQVVLEAAQEYDRHDDVLPRKLKGGAA